MTNLPRVARVTGMNVLSEIRKELNRLRFGLKSASPLYLHEGADQPAFAVVLTLGEYRDLMDAAGFTEADHNHVDPEIIEDWRQHDYAV